MESRQDGGALSSEQIRRMEENRRKAQERLLNKRAAQVSRTLPPTSSILPGATPVCGPPPAKRPALQHPYRSRDGPNPINSDISATAHSSSQFEHVQQTLLTHKRVFDSASRMCKGALLATSGLSTPSLSSLSTGTTRRDAGQALGGTTATSSSRGASSSSSSMKMVIILTVCSTRTIFFFKTLCHIHEEVEGRVGGQKTGGGGGGRGEAKDTCMCC